MENKPSVATVLQQAINPARYQLEIALDKTEGVANTAVASASMMLEQLEGLVLEQHNVEIDEFNELIGQAEDIERELLELKKEHDSLNANLESLQDAAKKARQKADVDMAQALEIQVNSKAIRTRLKELESMQPEKLKSKLAEKRRQVNEKQKILDSQRIKIRELKSKLEESDTKRTVLAAHTKAVESENNELRSRLQYHDGEVEQKVWKGDNGLEMYLYSFEWGLAFRPANSEIKIVNDINWHFEVRTNYGICILVSVTEWLAPFYPPCDYLSENWNTSIHDEIVDKIFERMEISHPHLCERVEWAKGVYLEDVDGISDSVVSVLNDAGFASIYSVLHTPQAKLVGILNSVVGNDELGKQRLKEFDDSTVRRLYAELNKLSRSWEAKSEEWKPVEIAKRNAA